MMIVVDKMPRKHMTTHTYTHEPYRLVQFASDKRMIPMSVCRRVHSVRYQVGTYI